MKKNIYVTTVACLVLLFFVQSCKKEEITTKTKITNENAIIAQKLDQIAQITCKISDNSDIYSIIKKGVQTSLDFGRDEEYRFIDILQPQKSKFSKGASVTIFGERLIKELGASITKSGSGNDSLKLYNFLIQGNVQIYWPYSEDWDGIEEPVIAFNPMDDNIELITAYRRVILKDGVINLESLKIDEAYAKKHPVWLINQNENDYENLPDFANNEVTKFGVTYTLPQKAIKKVLIAKSDYPLNSPDYVYNIQIGKIKSVSQWDTWVAGGSEFRFRMVGANEGGATGVIADFSTGVVSYDLTRRDIEYRHIKDVFALINMDWKPDETFNGFALWEEDGGSNNQTVTFNVGYKGVTIGSSFKIGNVDDLVYQLGMERSAFFSTNEYDMGNGTWDGFRIYSSGGVYWSMPWLIYPRAYKK